MKSLFVAVLCLFLVADAAKRCYSGSKDRFESRQCDTGVDGKFVCQKFTCEGGKLDSNFTVRACAPEGSRCEASSAVCADQGGVGYCSICDGDDCNSSQSLSLFATVCAVIVAVFVRN